MLAPVRVGAHLRYLRAAEVSDYRWMLVLDDEFLARMPLDMIEGWTAELADQGNAFQMQRSTRPPGLRIRGTVALDPQRPWTGLVLGALMG